MAAAQWAGAQPVSTASPDREWMQPLGTAAAGERRRPGQRAAMSSRRTWMRFTSSCARSSSFFRFFCSSLMYSSCKGTRRHEATTHLSSGGESGGRSGW